MSGYAVRRPSVAIGPDDVEALAASFRLSTRHVEPGLTALRQAGLVQTEVNR